MNIHNLKPMDPPKTVAKPASEEIRQKKTQGKESEPLNSIDRNATGFAADDLVEISAEAQKLQRSQDEMGVYKELLAKLPSTRAHVIYEALAKVKAGLYAQDKIVEEAAKKLLESDEFKDLIKP